MDGFICIDKPQGISSFSAVYRLRKICRKKKAGHTGTLDPMATGVLPVALGAATRFIELLPSSKKEYLAELRLGLTTDTLDITGKPLSQREINVSPEEFTFAAKSFVGESMQLPPMFSALLKDGVRLYELARKGEEVEREERAITIDSLDVIERCPEKGEYKILVSCTAGTYIRSLISDIGEKLGCGAVMTALVRTGSNGFKKEDAVTLEALQEHALNGSLDHFIVSVDRALEMYPSLTVTQPQAVRFKNGGALDTERLHGLKGEGLYRAYSPDGFFLGLGEIKAGSDSLSVKRVYTAKE